CRLRLLGLLYRSWSRFFPTRNDRRSKTGRYTCLSFRFMVPMQAIAQLLRLARLRRTGTFKLMTGHQISGLFPLKGFVRLPQFFTLLLDLLLLIFETAPRPYMIGDQTETQYANRTGQTEL